jgi:hypothetical protein
LARVSDRKLLAKAARLAVADAEGKARAAAKSDRVLGYRYALKAAALNELLTAVTVNA